MGKVLSKKQVREMVDLLNETIRVADQTIARSDATLSEIADATKIKVAATSYIGMLESIPSSEMELWFPVIRAVAIEILKRFFD